MPFTISVSPRAILPGLIVPIFCMNAAALDWKAILSFGINLRKQYVSYERPAKKNSS
jgi:hypothetical protein